MFTACFCCPRVVKNLIHDEIMKTQAVWSLTKMTTPTFAKQPFAKLLINKGIAVKIETDIS